TPPGTETIDLNPVPEEEIAAAYRQWEARGLPYRGSGYDSENYTNFGYQEKTADGRTFNLLVTLRKSENPLWKTDSLTSVSAHVDHSSEGYSLLRTGEIPVEPGPIVADMIAHPD